MRTVRNGIKTSWTWVQSEDNPLYLSKYRTMSTVGTFSFGQRGRGAAVPVDLGAPISASSLSPTEPGPAAHSYHSSLGAVIPGTEASSSPIDDTDDYRPHSNWSEKDAKTLADESGPSVSDLKGYDTFGVDAEKQRAESITGLARQLTRQSTRTANTGEDLFNYRQGSDLDPFSENFNAKKYVKGIQALLDATGTERLSGLSWSNLSVHGYGSDAGESPEAPCQGTGC